MGEVNLSPISGQACSQRVEKAGSFSSSTLKTQPHEQGGAAGLRAAVGTAHLLFPQKRHLTNHPSPGTKAVAFI